jgi:hypothetical protein
MCILYAYKVFLKFSSKCVHPNYRIYFIAVNVAIEFVLIYRPRTCIISLNSKKKEKPLHQLLPVESVCLLLLPFPLHPLRRQVQLQLFRPKDEVCINKYKFANRLSTYVCT